MRKIQKPWGHEEIWAETPAYVGKVLHIEAGHRLSLQHHERKDETLRVERGVLEVDLENDAGVLVRSRLGPGESFHVPPKRKHRMKAITVCDVVEVSTPELHDVVRHEDDYGRLPSTSPS